MTPIDQTLQRLLNAAPKATPEFAVAPPLGLETRVLAHWHAGGADGESVSPFTFLRRAMLGASLVLVLSAAWSLSRSGGSANSDEAAVLDYEIQTSLAP